MSASSHHAGTRAVAAPRTWPAIATVAVVAAVSVAWAALPLSGGGAGTRVVLIAAIASGAASVARLLAGSGGEPTEAARGSLVRRTLDYVLTIIRGLPWAEAMVVAVLVLEVLHRSRPWHTGLLGVALIGYLLALRQAEAGAGGAALRAQVPLIATGIGLSALAVAIAELRAVPGGDLSPVIRAVATTAAVVAVGLVIPWWLRRQR
jgi:hypothetical protein